MKHLLLIVFLIFVFQVHAKEISHEVTVTNKIVYHKAGKREFLLNAYVA